jgi:NitT/TauT family transport system substrate-binding protein
MDSRVILDSGVSLWEAPSGLVWLVSLLLLATVPPCSKASEQVRILGTTWLGFAPVFVAQDQNYFKALGIDVSMRFEDERSNVMAAMAHRDIEVDMRTVGEYQGRPRDESTPGVIIAAIDQSLGADGVLADGSIRSVTDLVGKTVASEPNVPARLILQLALKKSGHSLNELSMKEIVTADTVAVFADTSIAAVVSFEPFMSQSLKLDASRHPRILVSSRDYPGLIVDVLAVRQDDLRQNPAKYRKLLIGIYKAAALYQRDPATFIRLAAPHYNLSPAEFKAGIDGALTYTDLAWNKAALGKPGAPGTLYATFDTLMKLNLANGAADHTLTADHSFDLSVIAGIGAGDLQ